MSASAWNLRGVPHAERDRIVDEKLAMVGPDAMGRQAGVHELSGGMQQRVGLARAFATDADILLMDEPFSALDPLIRAKLQDELLDLQKRIQKTILFVSHDLDEALKLGNRIAIMEGGRIVQAGTDEDILLASRPNAYVAEFVKHMNPLNVLRGTAVMKPAGSLRRDDGAVAPGSGGARANSGRRVGPAHRRRGRRPGGQARHRRRPGLGLRTALRCRRRAR